MKNNRLILAAVLVAALSGTACAGSGDDAKSGTSYGKEQAKKDAAVGYRVAVIKGDKICNPPKDFNAAGFARPIDVLGTRYEPTGYEAQYMKQWSCSYQRPDGTIVQFGSSFTPLEQWRSSIGGKKDR